MCYNLSCLGLRIDGDIFYSQLNTTWQKSQRYNVGIPTVSLSNLRSNVGSFVLEN